MRRTFAGFAVVAALAAGWPAVATAQTTTTIKKDPKQIPDEPGEVRAGTGFVTVAPAIVAPGDSVTASFTSTGGVVWSLSGSGSGADCKGEVKKLTGEALKHSVTGTAGGPTSCTWKIPKDAKGSGAWSTVSASITGPCGDPEMVRQGRHEFASCAGAHSEDYFYVLGEGWGVSGTVQLSNRAQMNGVPVTLSGPDGGTKVTNQYGTFKFVVTKKGSYSLTAGNGFCVAPKPAKGECNHTAKFSVPGSQSVSFVPDDEATIRGRVLDASGRPILGATVRVVGPQGKVLQSDGEGKYEARVPGGTYTVVASRLHDVVVGHDDNDNPIKEQRPQYFCSSVAGTPDDQCNKEPRVEVGPDRTIDFTPEDEPGILIDITGSQIIEGESFRLTVTVKNTTKTDLTNVRFGEPTYGISVAAVPQEPNRPPPTVVAVTRVEGPTPALPTTMNQNTTATINYEFIALSQGRTELTVQITGDTPKKTSVAADQVVTVDVLDRHDVKRKDVDQAAKRGMESLVREGSDQKTLMQQILGNHAQTTLNLPTVTAAQVTAAAEIGVPPELAGTLLNAIGKPGEMAHAFLAGYGKATAEGFKAFDEGSRQLMTVMAQTWNDPEAMEHLSNSVTAAVKEIPGALSDNAGYLWTSMKQATTAEGLTNTLNAHLQAASSLAEGTGQILVGEVELTKQAVTALKDDPVAAAGALGEGVGRVNMAVDQAIAETLVGEGISRPLVGGAKLVMSGMSKGARLTLEALEARRLAAAAGHAPPLPIGTNAITGAVDETLAAAESAAMKSAQALPLGTVLDDTTILSAGGFSPTVRNGIQDVLKRGRERFGIAFKAIARTAEPYSSDLGAEAKNAWMKEKAAGAKDLLLGAPKELAGVVSVYPAELPEKAVLEGAEARVKGFTKDVTERASTQAKNWKAWTTDPNSKLRVIVDGASQTVPATGELLYPNGITVVEGLPANLVPYNIKYAEQLTEEKFVTELTKTLVGQGRTIAQAETEISRVKAVLATHPEKMVVSPEAVSVGKGVGFKNRLTGKWWGGDVDLQAVIPESGAWPSGKKGEMVRWFIHELRKIDRLPLHGWSDEAADLSSGAFKLAAEYQMKLAPGASAEAAATQQAKRFASLAKQFAKQSTDLENAAQDALRLAQQATLEEQPLLQAQARTLRQESLKLKDKAADYASYTKDKLLKEFPPGEKAIVITEGRAAIGTGTLGTGTK